MVLFERIYYGFRKYSINKQLKFLKVEEILTHFVFKSEMYAVIKNKFSV